jgi:5-methylcytosine-specific restriction endonuclease McrA
MKFTIKVARPHMVFGTLKEAYAYQKRWIIIYKRMYSGVTQAQKRGATVLEPVIIEVHFENQKGLCGICYEPMGTDYEMDHKIPVSRGGQHTWENTHAVHTECNRLKHTQTMGELK